MKSLNMLLIAAFIILPVATFAQEKAGKKDNKNHPVLYTCSMHDTLALKKPGNCPICGMKLEKSKKEQMKTEVTKNYSCPVHTDVTSDKAGKCSQCGKDLTISSKQKMKMEVVKGYACTMHPDVTSDKPGKCSKCGMELKENKKEHSNH